ncbi:LysR family transcriptional regulator [Marinomonas balearica]|uniref:DNA-binding transcriptional LysR family regulator n=1 Tax=Marinomonas balearica TaxID=491947 RepID=A0A4R6M284_9GAMM|nr:LysR family transcriptional regulator [Marinomonas balearica]TDO95313.1 DNA-binding transcriptional LysR family regulator [Marinomonas balearica]
MSHKNNEMPDIRGIQAFVAVMASGSMTGAAKQLGIGQPVITRVIRDLEAAIGFPVFERNGPRISPTPKGLRFFEEAQRLLTGYEQLADRAAAIRDTQVRSLTIAATPTMAAGLVPTMLSLMANELPAIVSLMTLDAEHLSQSLQSGAVDYGVCALPLSHAGLECLAISTSRLVAVLPQDDPLDMVSFEQFSERRLLTLANSYRIRHKIDMVLNDKGVIANEVLTTNNSLNAILAAREGLGIAIVDPVSVYGIGLHGIKVVPTEQEIPYEWGLFRRVGQDDISFVDILRKGFLEASKKVSEQVL